jgi:hypothetical protein
MQPEIDLSKIIVSIYKSKMHHSNASLSFILDSIKQPDKDSQKIFEQLYKLLDEGKAKEAKETKDKLFGFTICGIFPPHSRKVESINIDSYTGIIILDIDKLTNQAEAIALKEKATKIPYTLAAFISPSRKGVKILVCTNGNSPSIGLTEHKFIYKHINEYYTKKINCIVDNCGSDLSRVCYFSKDEDVYINPNPQIKDIMSIIILKNIENIIKALNKKDCYFQTGSRTNFIVKLAANANLQGIAENVLADYCRQYFIDKIEKRIATINSIYRQYKDNHGKNKSSKPNDSNEIALPQIKTLHLKNEYIIHTLKIILVHHKDCNSSLDIIPAIDIAIKNTTIPEELTFLVELSLLLAQLFDTKEISTAVNNELVAIPKEELELRLFEILFFIKRKIYDIYTRKIALNNFQFSPTFQHLNISSKGEKEPQYFRELKELLDFGHKPIIQKILTLAEVVENNKSSTTKKVEEDI